MTMGTKLDAKKISGERAVVRTVSSRSPIDNI